MIIGSFKAHFGSRISGRRPASAPAPAGALARNNTHHNRAGETWPPNGVRRSASAERE
jgi:hypothetical protein